MGSNNQENRAIAGALTFPVRSSDVQSVPVQPRTPRNLQGLLRFAMEATKAEDAPGNSELGPMDEEAFEIQKIPLAPNSSYKCLYELLGAYPPHRTSRLLLPDGFEYTLLDQRDTLPYTVFLEEALKSLTVDVAEVLQKAIKVLSDAEKMKSIQLGQPLPDEVQTSFSNLLEFIDDIDTANDFYKMGGFAVFPIAFGSENDEVRAQACGILAELCQNNPYCQARAVECGLLNVLLNLVQSERGTVLTKCLYAISCTSREYEPACRELAAQGGCEALARLLAAPEPAARTKAAFLVRYLCHNYAPAKEQFIKLNLVKVIAEQIKKGRDSTTEHLLSTLLALVEGLEPAVLAQCRDPGVRLKEVLENHLQHPDLLDDRFREEREYCQDLLTQLFANCPRCPVDEEVADR